MSYIGKTNPSVQRLHKGDGFGELTQKDLDEALDKALDKKLKDIKKDPLAELQVGLAKQASMTGAAAETAAKNLLAKAQLVAKDPLKREAVLAAFGLSFAGDPAFKAAWQDVTDGILTGTLSGEKTYKAALDKVKTQLPPVFNESPALSNLLTGSPDPITLARRSETLAKRYLAQMGSSINTLSGATTVIAFQAEYLGARGSLDKELLPFLSLDSDAKKIYTTTTKIADSLVSYGASIEKLTKTSALFKGQGVDAAGVIACTEMASVTIEMGLQMSELILGSAMTVKDKRNIDTVRKWTKVAVGCISSIAAGSAIPGLGTAAAAVGCGFSVLSSLGVDLFKEPTPPAGSKVKLAYFVPRSDIPPGHTKSQMSIIALDAQRLALVLRNSWGLTSYKSIYETQTKWRETTPETPLWKQPWLGAGGGVGFAGDRWFSNDRDFPSAEDIQKGSPVPGYTMMRALRAMNIVETVNDDIRTSKAAGPPGGKYLLDFLRVRPGMGDLYEGRAGTIALKRQAREKAVSTWDNATTTSVPEGHVTDFKDLEDIYVDFEDINVRAIETGAAIAYNDMKSRNFQNLRLAQEQVKTGGTSVITYAWEPKGNAFIAVNDLLNFFATVTEFELDAANGLVPGIDKHEPAFRPYLPDKNNPLPIRLYAVGRKHRSNPDKPGEDRSSDSYHKYCWTNLESCSSVGRNVNVNVYPEEGMCKELAKGVYARDRCAIKELASIRLLSAFSFLHLSYCRKLSAETSQLYSKKDSLGDLIATWSQYGQDPISNLMGTLPVRTAPLVFEVPRHQHTTNVPLVVLQGGPVGYRLMSWKEIGFPGTPWTGLRGSIEQSDLQLLHASAKKYNKIKSAARLQARVDQNILRTQRLINALVQDEKQATETTKKVLEGKIDFNTALKVLTQYAVKCNQIKFKDANGTETRFEAMADKDWKLVCCPDIYYGGNEYICHQAKKAGLTCPTSCTDQTRFVSDPAFYAKEKTTLQKAEAAGGVFISKSTGGRVMLADPNAASVPLPLGNDGFGNTSWWAGFGVPIKEFLLARVCPTSGNPQDCAAKINYAIAEYGPQWAFTAINHGRAALVLKMQQDFPSVTVGYPQGRKIDLRVLHKAAVDSVWQTKLEPQLKKALPIVQSLPGGGNLLDVGVSTPSSQRAAFLKGVGYNYRFRSWIEYLEYLKKADDARKAITTTSGNDTSGISVGTIAVAAGVALLALKFLK